MTQSSVKERWSAQLSAHFIEACEGELTALKPGNVHVFAPGHDMDISHFKTAARAAAPFIANPQLTLGERIEGAVRASVDAVQCNTNLGIILLTVPLAAAALASAPIPPALPDLTRLLQSTTIADADHVFRAIRVASPAGLGSSADGDVHQRAAITLREAMAISAERDRIARAYVTDFEDVLGFGLPEYCAGLKKYGDQDRATSALHMAYLARFADSHIGRKYGHDTAERVREEADILLKRLETLSAAAQTDALLAFDASLKSRRLNPGTTADFIVATLFAQRIMRSCGEEHVR